MAEPNKILSTVATTATRLPDLAIKEAQLIFIQDKQKIALDLNGKRTFYNQIVTLQTDDERKLMLAPVNGVFYFVIGTAVLWTYQDNQWVKITTPPNEIIHIGIDMPQLGSENVLYVNTESKSISVWDSSGSVYSIVAEKTRPIAKEDILALFQ